MRRRIENLETTQIEWQSQILDSVSSGSFHLWISQLTKLTTGNCGCSVLEQSHVTTTNELLSLLQACIFVLHLARRDLDRDRSPVAVNLQGYTRQDF